MAQTKASIFAPNFFKHFKNVLSTKSDTDPTRDLDEYLRNHIGNIQAKANSGDGLPADEILQDLNVDCESDAESDCESDCEAQEHYNVYEDSDGYEEYDVFDEYDAFEEYGGYVPESLDISSVSNNNHGQFVVLTCKAGKHDKRVLYINTLGGSETVDEKVAQFQSHMYALGADLGAVAVDGVCRYFARCGRTATEIPVFPRMNWTVQY